MKYRQNYKKRSFRVISFMLVFLCILGNGNMHRVEAATQVARQSVGIDVAKYQGVIDWQALQNEGIEYVMIRVGYRTESSGIIYEDPKARYNLQQAAKYGFKIGAYFYSSAITTEEAMEEANWTANYISQYPITYPVAYNCEGYKKSSCRQYNLTKEQRTAIACDFLDTIAACGYEPMFYANQKEMENSTDWNMDKLESRFKVWVAQYPAVPYPDTPVTAYSGTYSMWQYTCKGSVSGISGNVDKNIAYFAYDGTNAAKNTRAYVEVSANPEEGKVFTDLDTPDIVTAVDRTNLRCIPSTDSLDAVVLTIGNGQLATRTGVSEDGWSRVVYQGMTLYAVSEYLVEQ